MTGDEVRPLPPPDRAVAVTVVGIGADGWDGLGAAARAAVRDAGVLVGAARQLALVPAEATDARRERWPSPFTVEPAVRAAATEGVPVCVLASGDPMFFGVGTALAGALGADRIRVLPQPSCVSLACARLGWPVPDVRVVSVVGRPIAPVAAALRPHARLLVLSADGASPVAVAGLLRDSGYGGSTVTVLADLGSSGEAGWRASAGALAADPARRFPDLNVVAVECAAGPGDASWPLVPGLPDDAYAHDGQLTKREVRALTLAALGPRPGELLWDVGAGSGSVGIEWMRAGSSCRAIAVEAREVRAARVRANAEALGVPALRVVTGSAPWALAGLEAPDAVFLGGGLTAPGVVEHCWAALRPGGRIVANAVTAESEAALVRHRAELGGELMRVQVARSAPVGRFTGWRPMMPVTRWTAVKAARDGRTGDAREGGAG